MRIIACVNQKGGSGKTTTAVNLSAALAENGRRVLLIDLDAQASATSWYGIQNAGRELLDVLTSNGIIGSIAVDTAINGVSIVPASSWLVGAEKALTAEVGAETILRAKLRDIPGDTWDYILIDCPPTLGILTVNALAAAAEVLVPVEAHVMALAGVTQLLQTVDVVKQRLNPELAIAGLVACRVTRTRHAQEVVEQLRQHFNDQVFRTVIRENIRLAEAPSFGQPITIYDSGCNGAADYRALAAELMTQEKQR